MSPYRRYRRTDPRRWVVRVAVHRGVRGTFLTALALASLWFGLQTAMGNSGQPGDAPHLRLPLPLRAGVWFVCGTAALVLLSRSPDRRRTSAAVALLAVMPNVQLFSYLWSWIMSWGWVDDLVSDRYPLLKGSPTAGNGMMAWVVFDIALLAAAWAPVSWHSLRRALEEDEGQ